jgi:uncharacterized membrane protein
MNFYGFILLWILFFVSNALTESPLKIKQEEHYSQSNERLINVTGAPAKPGFFESVTLELLKELPNFYVIEWKRIQIVF